MPLFFTMLAISLIGKASFQAHSFTSRALTEDQSKDEAFLKAA